MSLYAIGDIHGYTRSLKALLEAVSPAPEDTVVFLGDYVDKGPDVSGTLDLLIQLSVNPSRIFLRGNHDQMFLNARRDSSDYPMWECLSGADPLASYGDGSLEQVFETVPETHFDFLESRCVDHFSNDEFIFVHAGISAHLPPEESDIDRLQWSSLGLAEAHFSGRTVICGHTSQESGNIADLGHTICIDTGITKGNHITCLNLTDYSFTQSSESGDITEGRLMRE